jgi:hypothetical protein
MPLSSIESDQYPFSEAHPPQHIFAKSEEIAGFVAIQGFSYRRVRSNRRIQLSQTVKQYSFQVR